MKLAATDLAFELIAREYILLLGHQARKDRAAIHEALTAAETRIAAHLFVVAEKIGSEPDWLIAAASASARRSTPLGTRLINR